MNEKDGLQPLRSVSLESLTGQNGTLTPSGMRPVPKIGDNGNFCSDVIEAHRAFAARSGSAWFMGTWPEMRMVW